MSRPYRILSLNGGGVRALLQAQYLKAVANNASIGPFWQDFDLIIGTSAGAIVAGALGVGKSPAEIADLFIGQADSVFAPSLFWKGRFALGSVSVNTSISSAPLRKLLEEVYGSAKLGDFASPMLAITATDLYDGEIRVFSPLVRAGDGAVPLVDAVLASAALPGAFPAHAMHDPAADDVRHYIDGGLWANAPLLAGVVLAMEQANVAPADIRVVSIGTAGTRATRTFEQYGELKVMSKKFYQCLFDITSAAAESVAHEAVARLIGFDRVLHVDRAVAKKIDAWDARGAKEGLPKLAQQLAGDQRTCQALVDLIEG